jgi:DNA-binding response OmpR family regulator
MTAFNATECGAETVNERPTLLKPVGPASLAGEEDFQLGDILVRPSLREAEANGAKESLEPRVMQVLVALARANGAVVSRDELIRQCWGGRIVGEDAINRLRLEDSPACRIGRR